VWLLAGVLWATSLPGADHYVDNVRGRDAADGTAPAPAGDSVGPFATIAKAILSAKPGDTIHLNPTGKLYRQSAPFRTGGEPGRPITLDGHGATLSGADPCPARGWQPWRDGVQVRPNTRSTGFLLVDGRMVFERYARDALRSGEFCFEFNTLYGCPPQGKTFGQCAIQVGQPDGAPVTLVPATWHASHSKLRRVRRYRGIRRPTWVKLDGAPAPLVDARDRLEPGMWCNHQGDLHYKPPVGRTIADLAIECVVRQNGVGMSGRFGHVVVRNLTAIHFGNDGYNIHGQVTAAEFYNCHAHHCFDEGFSAHDACETLLDGAVYAFCDNGIANVNRSGYSITRHVVIHNSRHVGFLIQTGDKPVRHELTDAVLFDNPSEVSASHLKADNVLIVRTPRFTRRPGRSISCGPAVELRRLTCTHGQVFVAPNGTLRMTDSLLGNDCIHVRADDPVAKLRLANVVVGRTAVLEWGVRPPWTRLAPAVWFARAGAAGRADRCTVRDLAFLGRLAQSVPVTPPPSVPGCTPALYRRFLEATKRP